MPLSFVMAYACLVAQRYRQRTAWKVFLLATIWKYENRLTARAPQDWLVTVKGWLWFVFSVVKYFTEQFKQKDNPIISQRFIFVDVLVFTVIRGIRVWGPCLSISLKSSIVGYILAHVLILQCRYRNLSTFYFLIICIWVISANHYFCLYGLYYLLLFMLP